MRSSSPEYVGEIPLFALCPALARNQGSPQSNNHEYSLDTGELIVTLEIAFGMVAEMAEIVSELNKQRHRSVACL
jgi:hypothetical protein